MGSVQGNLNNWQQQAEQFLLNESYQDAADLYEQVIEAEPDVRSHYWNLGLMLLLQGQEAEAQTTWLLAMAEGDETQVEQWTQELLQILRTEAERREHNQDDVVSWTIRQHIREIDPTDLSNLLGLIQSSIRLGNYSGDEPETLGLIELLQSKPEQLDTPNPVDTEQLIQTLEQVLDTASLHPQSLQFAQNCVPYVQDAYPFIKITLNTAARSATLLARPDIAAQLAELCLQVDPQNQKAVLDAATYHQNAGNNARGIEFAKRYCALVKDLPDRVYATHSVLRGIMHAGGGYSTESEELLKALEALLFELFQEQPEEMHQDTTMRLFSTPFYFPYVRDEPHKNMYLRREVAQLCESNIARYAQKRVQEIQQQYSRAPKSKTIERPLKIGYLSHCLRTHSVGWLARWLFKYHNQDDFKIHAYLVNAQGRHDPLQDWYVRHIYKCYQFPVGSGEIIDRIYEDDLDILIDLDSVTLDVCCEILSLRYAPIQATWLGWDASGLSAVDYYIADPYVLPDDAQDYYSEKIWRLPTTYLGVDGFEVGVPEIRRDHLDIPSDAVVYLSAQSGYKYNLQTARLQMQIIKEVPNSYFLIKDLVLDKDKVKDCFAQIAAEEGVNPDRLRFMPNAITSEIHRANLQIADILLDTYPYNGATTTMETLWMGIPVVTRVGQQFASRNSYTMLINAGITEGIAWTDEEYIEWGIRLGRDESLRQQINWKLLKSRQTAPLWNGKALAQEMEKAYRQMWQLYIQSSS
ncbi:MAG: O-linked N-acetylglucosamine transferase, SPINDLY family protein [Microcoleaceae cyanobacterium]